MANRQARVDDVPAIATSTGPLVDATGVNFRLPDGHRRLKGVRLYQRVGIPDDQLDFAYRRGAWSLRTIRTRIDRLEYLLELEHPHGGRETITDPTNPLRVAGAFGEKSVIEFPGYQQPWWLEEQRAPATTTELAIASHNLGSTIHGLLWSPEQLDADAKAPLLIVNDGPEYASLASLTDYAAAMIASEQLPLLRMALLAPGDRNRWYAASPAYARAVTNEVADSLAEQAPSSVRIGVGASLGALAMLHAHRLVPETFDGLFLQSGSFFTPDLDRQERRFPRFGPIVRFITELGQAVTSARPIPVVMTCGLAEENLGNNRRMVDTLAQTGHAVALHELRDVHNYTAWRDALDPHLSTLIRKVVDQDAT
jgi:enterochelin esterase-like enzyme